MDEIAKYLFANFYCRANKRQSNRTWETSGHKEKWKKHAANLTEQVVKNDEEINNWIEQARKEERERIEKEIDEIQNPYPEDIFRPLTIEQRKKAGDILLENNYTPDAVFGDWGRQVFLNTLKKVKAALRGGKE